MNRQSCGPNLHPDVVFPAIARFKDRTKLQTLSSVIGVLRYLTEKKFTHVNAINEECKLVYVKYFHDTVYCISKSAIRKRITKLWDIFKEGRKRWQEGNTEGKAINNYKELCQQAEKLYDVYATNEVRQKVCEKEWGVKMTNREMEYYQDQKSERRMECDHGVDPVWYAVMMRRKGRWSYR